MFTALWFKDTLERVVKTALQAFIASLILNAYAHISTRDALIIAGISAAFSAAKAIVAVVIPSNVSPASWASGRLRYVVDIVERLLFTFVQAFAAAMVTDFHISGLRSAVLAALSAAFSLLTSLISLPIPSQVSPASLVPATTAAPAKV